MENYIDIKSNFDTIKRDNYYKWREKQDIIGPIEPYENWIKRRNIGHHLISNEIKLSTTPHDSSSFSNKRIHTVGGLKYINNIEKLIKQIDGFYQKTFTPEEIDIIISSNNYYYDFIKNEYKEYWEGIIRDYPNVEIVTENDFLRSLGYDVPKEKDEKREDAIKMLNGKNISFIGVLLYINNPEKFCLDHNANYCEGIDPKKINVIVMSDSYYKKLKKGNYKPNTVLKFLSNISDTNKEIEIISENKLLSTLGITFDESNLSNLIEKGNLIYDTINDYTIIDLETTSKYCNQAEIIELAALKIRNGSISQEYNTLIKPKSSISDKISNLTGITNEMVNNAPSISDKIQEFIDFISDDIILGHNIFAYDINVLNRICKESGLSQINNDILDTLHFAHYCKIDVPNYKLTTLTNYFDIKHDAHRALNDCIANFECYERLKTLYVGFYNNTSSLPSKNDKMISISEEYSNISGKIIVLTGDFKFGKRGEIKEILEKLGAIVRTTVSGKTNYLIIGELGSSDWSFGNHGEKEVRALELQSKGKDIKIIKEEDFFVCQEI